MSGARFVRFYPSDWRSGCIGMTFEQEGFYVRVCAFIYETGRHLPSDDSVAAKLIGANTNAYRKLRDQLLAAGKIKRCEDGFTVPRAEKELAAATYSKGQQERQADKDAGGDTRQDALGDTPLDTPLEFSENGNEINGPLKSLKPIANSHKEIIIASTPLPPTQSAVKEQILNVRLKGQGKCRASEVKKTTLERAEGFGLDVDANLAEARKAKPANLDAYFQSICRRQLSDQLPGIDEDLLRHAFSSDGKAFATVCNLLLMVTA